MPIHGTIDAAVSGATFKNTGSVKLTIVDGTDTYDVDAGCTYTVSASSNDLQVQASSKTIATIKYPGTESCSVTKGTQVSGAKFDLTVSMKA